MKKFLKRWRFLNSHNDTEPVNTFPIEKVKVGKHTYGGLKIISWGSDEEGLEIGNYCSIAAGVSFLLGGNHKIDGLLTFPSKVKIFKVTQEEAITKGKIIVEDDVWIGTDVVVLSGVKIGKGSVIGARSVISKDIQPYSIVIGNPAKVIKKRFNDDVINYLISIDFSKFDFSRINSTEIEELYKKLETVEDAKNLISKLVKS